MSGPISGLTAPVKLKTTLPGGPGGPRGPGIPLGPTLPEIPCERNNYAYKCITLEDKKGFHF